MPNIVILARSVLTLEGGEIKGKRVAVVEDGPTLTHGGMTFGAGVVAARRFGAAEIVDPRPYARGELLATLARYPALERLLPAMGYGNSQMRELEETLNMMPAELVLSATPIDLRRVIELEEVAPQAGGRDLAGLLEPLVEKAKGQAQGAGNPTQR